MSAIKNDKCVQPALSGLFTRVKCKPNNISPARTYGSHGYKRRSCAHSSITKEKQLKLDDTIFHSLEMNAAKSK